MKLLHRHRPVTDRGPWGVRSVVRWVVTASGLIVMTAALAAAVGPYRQALEVRAVLRCERAGGACYDREPGLVVQLSSRTAVMNDPNGLTTGDIYYKATLQRADGTQQTRGCRRISTSASSRASRPPC